MADMYSTLIFPGDLPESRMLKIKAKMKGKLAPGPYSVSDCSQFRHGVRLGKMDGHERLDRFQADCR
jgi:hypothetical protein